MTLLQIGAGLGVLGLRSPVPSTPRSSERPLYPHFPPLYCLLQRATIENTNSANN